VQARVLKKSVHPLRIPGETAARSRRDLPSAATSGGSRPRSCCTGRPEPVRHRWSRRRFRTWSPWPPMGTVRWATSSTGRSCIWFGIRHLGIRAL